MKKYYLVCVKCNGYYELGESSEDLEIFEKLQFDNKSFECSGCGGEVILVEDINNYFKYYVDNKVNRYNKKFILNKASIFLISLLIIVPLTFFLINTSIIDPNNLITHNHSLLSSDYRGYITKDVYSNINAFSSNTKTIAIVTGMHPREKLSKNVTNSIISNYNLKPNTQIVHYDIEVTNNPDDYRTGRNNGEGLVVDYILPDVLKSNDDLVIICHDHELGYGEGYYVATPQMDESSIKLAENLKQSISGFNYIRSDNIKETSNSAKKVSKPLALNGYKTLVYEIPEWSKYSESYSVTESVIRQCFNFI
ncbi:MAG: hypothetical protein ACPK7O_04550 [Methanobacterium sp.]